MTISDNQGTPDFSEISPDIIKEIHRQGEVCLQGTVQIAVAADQRATTLTGIMGAGTVALTAATVTMLSGDQPNPALVGSGAITALLLFIGALFCAGAARSVDFHVPGYEPRKLAKSDGDETWLLRYAAEDLQARIDANRRTLERSSWFLTVGRRIAVCAVPIGAIAFFTIRHLS